MEVRAIDIVNALGCSKASISKETRKGNLIRGDDKLYDLQNPTNQQFLVKRGINLSHFGSDGNTKKKEVNNKKSETSLTKKPKKKEIKSNDNDCSDFESITGIPEEYMDMSIKNLVMKHGGPLQLKIYVEILQKLFASNKIDVEIQERRRILIEKDFVEKQIFPYLNLFMQQVFDYPESVIEKEIAEIKADEDRARVEIPKMHRENISRIAKDVRKKIMSQIKSLYKKHDKEKDNG